MKILIVFLFLMLNIIAEAQFPPPAGHIGSTAIYKDSAVFVDWATACSITRGYQDLSNPALGYANSGDSTMAFGIAGSNGVVSLGDGGIAILTFAKPIKNGPGWDFAIFENSFNDSFLELAFVEVSSDGVNFYRFPATSNTQDTLQIDGFGSIDATKINNLAGKYRALYGTPFDLEELSMLSGLDVNHITHIKIIDVVGCIQNNYARFDHLGHKINDPWNTPFASSGFDLDALGVINQETDIYEMYNSIPKPNIYPNPIKDNAVIQYHIDYKSDVFIYIIDVFGKIVYVDKKENQLPGWQFVSISTDDFSNGIYFLKLKINNGLSIQKIIISHE